jgi:GxxExxY protein
MERDQQTFGIIGAAMEVHRELGSGFLEAVYTAALALEFAARGIPFRSEVELPVYYKGNRLGCGYRADFICFENILLEIKALISLTSAHQAQLINYLKATQHHRGLLINFGAPSLEYKRIVFGSTENLCQSVKSVDPIKS